MSDETATLPEPPGVSLEDIDRMLVATPAILWAELQGMSQPLMRWRPAPGAWCALEIVGHLIETDLRAFSARIVQVRNEPGATFDGFDPVAVARRRDDREADPQALVDEFARVRKVGVGLVRGLTAADLAVGGVDPEVGGLTIANLLAAWVAHDRAHLAQVGLIVRAATLAGMGNARGFGHAVEAARWQAGHLAVPER